MFSAIRYVNRGFDFLFGDLLESKEIIYFGLAIILLHGLFHDISNITHNLRTYTINELWVFVIEILFCFMMLSRAKIVRWLVFMSTASFMSFELAVNLVKQLVELLAFYSQNSETHCIDYANFIKIFAVEIILLFIVIRLSLNPPKLSFSNQDQELTAK